MIEYVYCLNCEHFTDICCDENCNECLCDGCQCFNPEDSASILIRKKYKVQQSE
jgi:hypothetical protein